MDSSHIGELGLGSTRSSAPRKGKKSSSEKPKQPQRGLGVAQLEKIRLQNQMAGHLPSLHSPFHSNLRMEDMRVDVALSSSPSSSNTASSSSVFALHPNIMMGYGDTERRHISDGEFHSSPPCRPLPDPNSTFLPHHCAPATATRPLWEQTTENSVQKKQRHDGSRSTSSMSQNSDPSDAQEVDLELRLSL
ncbi:protein SPEAR1-like [Phoenix dactylifera]|uniref:Protein SPEAR1-like n=1 Tax=Phoenix dactylifera TaxID=42345 RepID=A0A8B7MUG0_PHODC|nr:protein SPEAR1-like [Phoenix dactylifera]